jgi:hypothetical protein
MELMKETGCFDFEMQTYQSIVGLGFPKAKLKGCFCLVLFSIGILFSGQAQDSIRIRKTVRTLCASGMAGRGYTRNGHLKASAFIGKTFSQIGLAAPEGNFFQDFPIQQVVFYKAPEFRLNGRRLIPGRHFLPPPNALFQKGTFRIIPSPDLKEGEFALTPQKQVELQAPAFLKTTEKLTHTLRETPEGNLNWLVLKSALESGDSLAEIRVEGKWEQKLQSRNVLGMVKGRLFPEKFLVVCAHYDHLGSMGKVFFPGANDNASGIALLLEMAREIAGNPLPYSVLFIAFGGEEAGLIGSRNYVDHPVVPLEKIRFVMNLDLMGFGGKGGTVVNATVFPKEFARLDSLNRTGVFLPELKLRGKAANSDHYPFSERGVPAFFLYLMGGPGYYHDIDDRPETLDWKGLRGTFGLLMAFLRGF